ncbi:putative fluoride ion transporter CrcB [Cellulomonas aerilata]|uniref:Fluoride-specific ion channel FluC n=1 Tax=Cellulomonas aerilata TaxID=515326 RepID=A0A512DA59_9CELL|nr:putative fluoride ion transporter CrcB [Cellulomonas aerilata]
MVDGLLRARSRSAVPVGTMVVNLTGAFALGFLTGWLAGGLPSTAWTVAGTGFLGGYTTFSTASVETALLLERRQWRAALVNAVGMLVAAVALAALGVGCGQLLR